MAHTRRFEENIILVSSLQAHSVLSILSSIPSCESLVKDVFEKELDACAEALAQVDVFVKEDGTLASHLDFNANQYKPSFVDRPHMHWTWGGLCHANSGGDWETATVAFLEPLSAFRYVFGCTPYDTMVVGPHQLSRNSIILVPKGFEDRIRRRLTQFEGQIVCYDAKNISLRDAVSQIMDEIYPYAYKLLNKKKSDISILVVSNGQKSFDRSVCNSNGYNCDYGYFDQYFIKAPDSEEVSELLQSPATVKHHHYREYAEGKHIGIHQGSKSDIEKNPTLKTLKLLSEVPWREIAKHMKYLVGATGSKKTTNLISVYIYEKLEDLHQVAEHTGMHDYAHYLVKKAMAADLQSIHHDLGHREYLKEDQLEEMIEDNYVGMLQRLRLLAKSGTNKEFLGYRQILLCVYGQVLGPVTQKTLIEIEEKYNMALMLKQSRRKHGFWSDSVLLGVGTVLAVGIVGSFIVANRNSKQ